VSSRQSTLAGIQTRMHDAGWKCVWIVEQSGWIKRVYSRPGVRMHVAIEYIAIVPRNWIMYVE
jgi:hypothetical protein